MGLWHTPSANEDRAEKYTQETSQRHWQEGRQIHLAQAVKINTERKSVLPASRQLTLFAADSLASLTVMPGSDEARKMTVTSGRNIAALLPNSGRLGLLVKMCLESERLFSTRCYLTWNIWDTPQQRLIFRLSHSTPRISDTASGLWPTPTIEDSKNNGNPSRFKKGRHGVKLNGLVALMPTPTVNDSKNNGGPAQAERRTPNLNSEAGGALNPEFVEWMMNFPRGWTDISGNQNGLEFQE